MAAEVAAGASPRAEAPPSAPAVAWRGIDELARLVGAYCWVENRIFELTGAWASAVDGDAAPGPEPAWRVWSAGVSRRHGLVAGRWFERLPVRAGVDRAGLVTAPSAPLADAFDALAATADTQAGAEALVLAVLPRLQAVYDAHRRTAAPVSEAPVLEVLVGAHRDMAGEISGGRSLLGASADVPAGEAVRGREIERAFEETDVFPAVRTS